MHIVRLKIANVRTITAMDISLLETASVDQCTVIVGPNGVGKTALLQSIAATILGPVNALVMMEGRSAFINASASEAQTDVWLRGNEEDDLREPGDKHGDVHLRVTWRRDLGAQGHPPPGKGALVASQFWEGAAFGATPKGWYLAGYGLSRSGAQPSSFAGQLMAAPPRRSAVATLFRPDASLQRAQTWISDTRYSNDGESSIDSYFMHLRLLMSFLNDGLLPLAGYQLKRIDHSDGMIVYSTPLGDIPIEALGLGFESSILLVIDILRQMSGFFGARFMGGPGWKVPEGESPKVLHSGVVLIDEVDAYLSPQFVMHLLRWLMAHFPRVQFIVTSHMPVEPGEGMRILTMPRSGVLEGAKRGGVAKRRGRSDKRTPGDS